jgi:hypothetical protein
MLQPQTVEGTVRVLDKDQYTGQKLYITWTDLRSAHHAKVNECHTMSKIPIPSMHYLKRETSLFKACMTRCSQSTSSPSATRAWGFSPMATCDLH